ncbi:MAG TPA: class I SAM-dependent methyltransferase [Gemmataceae bacterium]|jgi:SAM-dependent methyltransferase|nr:class I SAM-dependent methyltransferase [Gemmataceae bacterium]
MNSTILQAEAAFADGEYAPQRHALAISPRMYRKYAEPRYCWDWREFSAQLLGNVAEKALLDYGCGMGEEAVYFAKLGATVTAIDASQVGIDITRQRAAFNGQADRVQAFVMDATHCTFPDNSFDLIHGLGILHHIGLQEGLGQVHRLLKPGGVAVFLEPMGNIRFIENCKRWLHARLERDLDLVKVTEYEENLKLRDIPSCAHQFSVVRAYPYHLSYRARRLICPKVFHSLLERVDYQLLRIGPFLKPFAGAVVIHLRK